MAHRKKTQTKTTPTSFKLGNVCRKPERDPQPKIDAHFLKVVKKKRPEKNFQGYSLKKCRFRKSLGRSCYVPRNYGRPRPSKYVEGSGFCINCLLEPCFLYERNEEIEEAGEEILLEHRQSTPGFLYLDRQEVNDVMNKDMKEHMKSVLEDIFSIQYVKKFGLPNCAKCVADREHPPSVRSPTKAIMMREPLFPPKK